MTRLDARRLGTIALGAAITTIAATWLLASASELPPADSGAPTETPFPTLRDHATATVEPTVLALARTRSPATPVAAITDRSDAAEPPSNASPDAAWIALPRERRDLLLLLSMQPDQAQLELVLRSVTFNPRDLWLNPEWRERIRATLVAAAEEVAARTVTASATRDEEFAAAETAGRAVPIGMEGIGALRLLSLGVNPVTGTLRGQRFGVAREHLPRTTAALRELHNCGRRLVARLADDFAAAGALTGDEQHACLAGTDRVISDW